MALGLCPGKRVEKRLFSQGGKSAAFICALSTGGRQTSAFPHPLRLSLGFRGIFNLLLRSAGKRSSSWVRGLRPGQALPPRLLRQDTPQLPVHLPPVSGQPFPHHTATGHFLEHLPPAGAPLPAFTAKSLQFPLHSAGSASCYAF